MNRPREIYLDHAASSLIHPEVTAHLTNLYQKQLGNPASIHHSGVKSSLELEQARLKLSAKLGCLPEELIFTSGATEANNLVLKGVASLSKKYGKNEIIISNIEHSSVSAVTALLAEQGIVLKIVRVNDEGKIEPEQLKKLLSSRTLLVSVIHGNNEIGTIQNLKELSQVCHDAGAFFHSDGAQGFCKTPVHFQNEGLDFYSISGHKIHGPRGVGALIIKKAHDLAPQMIGGGQERGLRSGTVAVELISAMARATDLFTPDSCLKMTEQQSYIFRELKKLRPDLRINGSLTDRLPSNLSFAFPGIQGKWLLQKLDLLGIRVSVGSACNATKKTPSSVIRAIGQSEDQALETIRIGLGIETTQSEIDTFIVAIKELLTTS